MGIIVDIMCLKLSYIVLMIEINVTNTDLKDKPQEKDLNRLKVLF